MFDWLKNWRINAKKASHGTTFSDLANESPAQVELTNKSIACKKSGDVYLNQGEFEKASACYRQAIAYNPNYAEAYNNLGNACREQKQFDDAELYLKQATRLKPELANAYYNLATLLLAREKLDGAIENFYKTLEYRPKHYAAQAVLLHLLQKMCKWNNLDSHIKTLRHEVSSPAESAESIFSPFAFMAMPGSTPEEQKICAERWVQLEYQSLAPLRNELAFDHKRPRNKKITLGYLSADFRNHATATLMAEVFELHNRDQFHITAYSYGPDDGSEMRKRLKGTFDQFVDIRGNSDKDSACRIYADHIDILVDLKGFTENNRSGILALRPAPLQVNYLGYPGTMGADFVDYLIADRFIIPPEQQKHYTEKIVYLPNCYQPNDRTRQRLAAPTRTACGLPESGFIFCCFNQTYKITPDIFDIWCRLLISIPDSVLWLYINTPYSEENLKREAENRGINPARLIMAPMQEAEKHLARLQCADLFLDTLPINAHTTCSDALWMGLPVVTCAGDAFPSRVAGSLLSAIGVPELITYNLKDYYNLALDLASDKKKLDAIRSKIIANRDTAPLFDSERFTRNLEQAYVQMMDDYSNKTAPLG